MVTMTAKGNWSIDNWFFEFKFFGGSSSYTRGPTKFTSTASDGDKFTFIGSGFKYKDGFAIGSSSSKDYVTSYSKTIAGDNGGIYITGMKTKLSAFANAEKTKTLADDDKVWASIFKGDDTFKGGNGAKSHDFISGFDGKDTMYGNAGNDSLWGDGGSDRLYGGVGNDALDGGSGNDRLYGNKGADHLFGGTGADRLYGGAGKDVFFFNGVKQSKPGSPDTIYDFSRKEGDKISLSGIDANTKVTGDQAFKFIGTEKFHKKAGELRYEKKSGDTFVQADVNGDGKADFAIRFDDSISFAKGDFIL